MDIKPYNHYNEPEILALYESAGWISYTHNPAILTKAFAGSLLVLAAFDGKTLAGLVRVVGDGCSILYIQDLIVLPAYRRRGIATQLLKQVMELCPARQTVLLCDDTPENNAFYANLFRPSSDFGCCCYVRIDNKLAQA